MKLFALALTLALPVLAAAPPVEKGTDAGSPTARITLEVFSDFECPACKTFHENTLPQLIRDFVATGKVYLVNRQFPLNLPEHKYSRQAAIYAVAAARVGKYQAVADVLFKNQSALAASGRVWETVASVLTPEQQKRVQALAKEPAVQKQVQDEVMYGASSGINATPTLMVTRGNERFPLSGYALGRYSLLKSMIDDLAK
jgi:protein-disulfide isomerase